MRRVVCTGDFPTVSSAGLGIAAQDLESLFPKECTGTKTRPKHHRHAFTPAPDTPPASP